SDSGSEGEGGGSSLLAALIAVSVISIIIIAVLSVLLAYFYCKNTIKQSNEHSKPRRRNDDFHGIFQSTAGDGRRRGLSTPSPTVEQSGVPRLELCGRGTLRPTRPVRCNTPIIHVLRVTEDNVESSVSAVGN
ncbi:hypothetical protein MAR_023041, partial [Mya arenaria]